MQLNIKITNNMFLKNFNSDLEKGHVGSQSDIPLKKLFTLNAVEEVAFNYQIYAKENAPKKTLYNQVKKGKYSKSFSGKDLLGEITHIVGELLGKAKKAAGMFLPSEHFGLVWGIAFGDDELVDPQMKKRMANLGIQHVLSASGYNVNVLIGIVSEWVGDSQKKLKYGLISLVLVIYSALCLFQPSIVRATLQALIACVAAVVQKPAHPRVVFLITVGAMILVRPDWVSAASFQLSAAATLGILIYSSKKKGIKEQITHTTSIKNIEQNDIVTARKCISQKFFMQQAITTLSWYVLETCRLSLAASLFTIPIIMWHFGEGSVWSPISNIFIQWFIEAFTCISLGYIALASFSQSLAVVFSPLISAFCAIFESIVSFAEMLRESVDFPILHTTGGQWCSYVIFLGLFFFLTKKSFYD